MAKNYNENDSPEAPPPGVVKALKTIDDWSYDIFALGDAANNRPLKYITHYLFTRYGIVKTFKINHATLEKFINRIEEGYYRFQNIYHNSLHAADVTQTTHYMLRQTCLQHWLTDLEIFAILLAAIIHDYEHTGTMNSFHIMTRSDRALLYNDQSVQENHHVSAAFFVLRDEDCNILSNLSVNEYRELRSLVIDLVLSTDMAFHFQLLKDIQNQIGSVTIEKVKAMELVLHTCDISNCAKEWRIHSRWTAMILEEFFLQGDMERELGLPISKLCDRYTTSVPQSQIQFIDLFMEPTLSICANMLEYVLEPIADQCKNFNANLDETNTLDKTPGRNSRKKFRIRKPWVACMADNVKKWREQIV